MKYSSISSLGWEIFAWVDLNGTPCIPVPRAWTSTPELDDNVMRVNLSCANESRR